MAGTSKFLHVANRYDGYSVAQGLVPGERIINKFGRRAGINIVSAPEDIWFPGGLFNWETSADEISVSSSDAADGVGGAGAQLLDIECLLSDWSYHMIEDVVLNGVTPVVVPDLDVIRINRAFVHQPGTYHGTNAGDITATLNGNTCFVIGAGVGQTQVARYSVPLGRETYIEKASVTVDASKAATIRMNQCENADVVAAPFGGANRLLIHFDSVSGTSVFDEGPLGPFPEKTDLWWNVSSVSSNDTAVSVRFLMREKTL